MSIPLRAPLFVALVAMVGCGKSAPQPTVLQVVEEPTPPPAPASEVPALLKKLRSTNPPTQRAAADALSEYLETDPAAIPGLLEALKDPANRGEGKGLSTELRSTREAAIVALVNGGEVGEKAAVEKGLPILIAALKDANPATREHAAIAIGRMGELAKPAVEGLWPLAGDASQPVRNAGYDALRAIGPPSAGPAVKLLTHASEDVRKHAAGALAAEAIGAGMGPIPADAVPDLAKALADTDPDVRLAAADALKSLGAAAKDAVPALIERMKLTTESELTNPSRTALAPLEALAAIGEPAVGPLTALLADRSLVNKIQAAYTLGLIGPPAKAATDTLEKALRDPANDVAVEAAVALVLVTGDSSKIAELVKGGLANKDPKFRAGSVQTITRMGPGSRGLASQVIPLLDDPDADVRKMTMTYVAVLDAESGKAAVPLLAKRLATDSDEFTRRRAAELLEALGANAAEAAEALGKAVASDESSAVRLAAVYALTAIGPMGKPGLPGLIAAANDAKSDTELRTVALAALPRIRVGDITVSEELLKVIADKAAPVRIAAVQAIARITPGPSNPAVFKLAELASSDPASTVRAAALRALVELGTAAGKVSPTIEPLTKASPAELALRAKVAIARIEGKPANALPAVRTGLAAKSPAERLAAVEMLPFVQPTAEDVKKLMPFLKDKSPVTRRIAAEAAGRCGAAAKPLVARLTKMVSDPEGDVRVAAIEALGTVEEPTPTVFAALRNAVKVDPNLRRVVGKSFRQLNGMLE